MGMGAVPRAQVVVGGVHRTLCTVWCVVRALWLLPQLSDLMTHFPSSLYILEGSLGGSAISVPLAKVSASKQELTNTGALVGRCPLRRPSIPEVYTKGKKDERTYTVNST